MIRIQDYDTMLRDIGREYCILTIRYVPDLAYWARENGMRLSEPAQPMKLVTDRNELVMTAQSEIEKGALDGIITGLEVRWQVVDNAADISQRFKTVEEKLAYCFLKEYARTQADFAEDERLEDEWALAQMERRGLFGQVKVAERDREQ